MNTFLGVWTSCKYLEQDVGKYEYMESGVK